MNIAIAGASGRMGRTLIEAVLRAGDLKLAAALEQKGNAHVGRDAGELAGAPCGVKVTDDVAAGDPRLRRADRLHAAGGHARASRGVPQAGREDGDRDDRVFAMRRGADIAEAARDIAIVMAPNFSVGVNVDAPAARRRGAVARQGLRRRDHRGAPPAQGRCAVGHRAAHGRSGGAGARPRPAASTRSTAARA